MNNQIEALKDYIREPFAWPGGYLKILLLADGSVICADCARDNFREIVRDTKNWKRGTSAVEYVGIEYEQEEDCPLLCDECSREVDPALRSGEVAQ